MSARLPFQIEAHPRGGFPLLAFGVTKGNAYMIDCTIEEHGGPPRTMSFQAGRAAGGSPLATGTATVQDNHLILSLLASNTSGSTAAASRRCRLADRAG